MTVVFPVPEIFPDPRARFIQMLDMASALASLGARVRLMAGFKRGFSPEDILASYGLAPSPNLTLERLPVLRKNGSLVPWSWHGPFHAGLLFRLLFQPVRERAETVILVRHLKLADFLLRVRRVHGLPLVYEAHELFHPAPALPAGRAALRRRELRVLSGADGLVAKSEYLKTAILGVLATPRPVHVVRHGLRREWLEIERSGPPAHILYAGGLYPWKGVEVLIEAMRYLPGERALILGGGDELSELKRLAAAEGVADRVDFAGPVPHADVPGFLARAKVAVVPNLDTPDSRQSAPLKMMEYMACGLPIVASDLPTFREVLDDGVTGLLVAPGSPQALAEGIGRLVRDPDLAGRLSSAARERAEAFTYDQAAAGMLEVLKLARAGSTARFQAGHAGGVQAKMDR
jgi:glycosyltransferase involved in cell wall biosynthesis